MFGILAKFFRFSGKENGNKFKLSMVIGLIEALASAMKIPAIMYILIGLLMAFQHSFHSLLPLDHLLQPRGNQIK